jgi:hypothetical protein
LKHLRKRTWFLGSYYDRDSASEEDTAKLNQYEKNIKEINTNSKSKNTKNIYLKYKKKIINFSIVLHIFPHTRL